MSLDQLLRSRVEIRKGEAHGDRLRLQRGGFLGDPACFVFAEHGHRFAEGVQTLLGLDHARARHDRQWLGLGHPVEMRAQLVADLQDIAKAFRHDHRNLCAVACQECVGADREAVHEEIDIGRFETCAVGDTPYPLQHRIGAARGRRNLVEVNAVGIDQNKIGKRAADICRKITHERQGSAWVGEHPPACTRASAVDLGG